MPPQPCKGCKWAGHCESEGLVNKLAVDEWLADHGFECADFEAEYFRGIEGVWA